MPQKITDTAGSKPGATGPRGATAPGGMSTAAVRRQSIVDHGGATPATGGAGGSRAALIMTSSAQSRRVSFSNVAHPVSAVSRSYENSYKTEPEKPFCAAAARRVIREVLESMLTGVAYDKEHCKQLTVSVADVIKKRVKELGFPRYKLVTSVSIGQADDAGLAFASRCVWNVQVDSFAEHNYKNASIFAVGLVYALYCD